MSVLGDVRILGGGGVLFHLTIEGCRWEPSLELARGCSAWNLEEEAGHRKRK